MTVLFIISACKYRQYIWFEPEDYDNLFIFLAMGSVTLGLLIWLFRKQRIVSKIKLKELLPDMGVISVMLFIFLFPPEWLNFSWLLVPTLNPFYTAMFFITGSVVWSFTFFKFWAVRKIDLK